MILNPKLKRLKKHLTKEMDHWEDECEKWDGVDGNKLDDAEGKLGILVEVMDLMDWDLKRSEPGKNDPSEPEKFKRFTHKNGVTTIHFKDKDEFDVGTILIILIVGLICLGVFIGGLFLIGPI
jgi:hypothetical protein